MAIKLRRKRLITRLYDAIDQLDELILDAEKKPSVLKAVVSKTEILHDLLKREDSAKAAKAAAKAAALAPAPDSEKTAEQLIARVAELKNQRGAEKQ
jgi:hypothetical protein